MHDLDYIPPSQDDRLLVEEEKSREHIVRLSDGSEKTVTGRLEVTRSMHLVVWDGDDAALVLKASKWDAIRHPGVDLPMLKDTAFDAAKDAAMKAMVKGWASGVGDALRLHVDDDDFAEFYDRVAKAIGEEVSLTDNL